MESFLKMSCTAPWSFFSWPATRRQQILLGNGMFALLSHADELRRLWKDPALVPSAVEEMLRYDSPIQFTTRLAKADIEIHDTKIREGEWLYLVIGAANRDPAQFTDPDRFDVGRAANKHIAFGAGALRRDLSVSLGSIFRLQPRLLWNNRQQRSRCLEADMNGFSTWVLAALLAVGQSAEPVAPPKQNVFREGDRLIFSPSVTDQELQAFPPSPEIRGIFFAVGPNRWKSTLTAAGLESLARWTNLQSLGLPEGVVTDEILLKLSSLTQLRSFDLMGTRYGASVTARGLAVLSSFPHLRELRLDGLVLTDEVTIPIGKLTELRSLQFYRAPLTDVGIANLSRLTMLEELGLGESRITDKSLEIIGKMTRLKWLDLRAPVTGKGLSALRSLKDLQWLTLGPTVNDDAIEAMAPLKNLEHLYLEKAQITDSQLHRLLTFPVLKTLDLSGTRVTDEGMKSIVALPALTDLRLENTRITDKTLSLMSAHSSSALPRLEHLTLRETAVTDEAIARLKTARPTLILFK